MNIGAGCHPNKVKVSGPGVAKTGLKAFEPTYFTVDCAEAGQGKMTSFKARKRDLHFTSVVITFLLLPLSILNPLAYCFVFVIMSAFHQALKLLSQTDL